MIFKILKCYYVHSIPITKIAIANDQSTKLYIRIDLNGSLNIEKKKMETIFVWRSSE